MCIQLACTQPGVLKASSAAQANAVAVEHLCMVQVLGKDACELGPHQVSHCFHLGLQHQDIMETLLVSEMR